MKKSSMFLAGSVILGLGLSAFAEEIVLYQNDFQAEDSLNGFVNSCKLDASPPPSDLAFRGSEAGDKGDNYFFRGMNQSFGTSVKLNKIYKVDETTQTVEIKVRVRGNGDAAPLMVDLSSRTNPAYPFQWSTGKGEGFGAKGYRHPNAVNCLFYFKNTEKANEYTENKPFIKFTDEWYTWHIVYNHPTKTISFFIDDATEPALVYKNVDMTGYAFRSIWFMGMSNCGCDYDDVKVTATTKAAEPAMAAK